MTREQAEFLADALRDDGLEVELRESYSGRGMCGRETFAVVADGLGDADGLGGILRAALRAARDDPDEIPDFDNFSPSVDSMGRGSIVVY